MIISHLKSETSKQDGDDSFIEKKRKFQKEQEAILEHVAQLCLTMHSRASISHPCLGKRARFCFTKAWLYKRKQDFDS